MSPTGDLHCHMIFQWDGSLWACPEDHICCPGMALCPERHAHLGNITSMAKLPTCLIFQPMPQHKLPCSPGIQNFGSEIQRTSALHPPPGSSSLPQRQTAAFMLADAHKQPATREMLLWMTPLEAPKALQASECSELLDPMRANCWISAQH